MKPALAWPPDVTTTFPLVAPTGTVATMAVALQLVVEAAVPLNLTVPEVPKFVPEIVTDWPIPPGFGEMEEIVGVWARAKQQAKTTKPVRRPILIMVDRSTPNLQNENRF